MQTALRFGFVFLICWAAVAAPASSAKWWETLHDPELNSLMERARAANLDVKTAAERVLEVRAERRIARAALLPSINQSTNIDRIRGGFEDGNTHVGNGAPGSGIFVAPFESNLFQVGLDASWEIDLFGGRRHELQAATADVLSSEEARHGVLISTLAEVARTYIDLRGTQLRLQITQQNIALQRDSLHLADVRAQAGLGTQLDVERQREQLNASESTVPTLQAEITLDVHALSVLIGAQPDTLAPELNTLAPVPADPPGIAAGVPAAILQQRPDLREARANIVAAAARVGAAKANLFPKIILSGAMGRQATDWTGLTLGAGNFFSVGPSITLPIFEAGRIRANIAARKSQLTEALLAYQQAVLNALRESEDAFEQYTREHDRRAKLAAAVDASRDATKMATELYQRGLTDFLSVIDAQRQQLQDEDALAQSDATVGSDLVRLYKALGGGWS